MVKTYSESTESHFEGTIIDIETIGEFERNYNDSREYRFLSPVVFGLMTKDGIKIHYVENENSIDQLKKRMEGILPKLKRPLFAFNSIFERGVLFHSLGLDVSIDGELNMETRESKQVAVRLLGISNYDDPFDGSGWACKRAWLNGEIHMVIMHNRSCLLKERDILMKRGFRQPDELRLIR